MAGFTLNFRTTVSGGGTESVSGTVAVTADALDSRSVVVTAGADRQVDLAFQLSKLKGYIIQSDADVLMQSNSAVGTGTAGDDISLAANEPMEWYEGNGYNPHFSVDVTSLYFTKTGSGSATVEIRVLKDSSVGF